MDPDLGGPKTYGSGSATLPLRAKKKGHYHFTDLCVLVEVPEVEPARAVHSREEGGMDGRPGHVVHIVTVVLKAVQRLVLLR
jgi:hypothetical protein